MTRPILRHWCGRCEYPGKASFLLGTVQAESEMDAFVQLVALWSKISPHPVPTIAAIPGMLAFVDEAQS